jgi:hypothetical protein
LACAGCTGGFGAMVDSLRYAVSRGDRDPQVRLDPRFDYLRVTADGRVLYLARGFTDAAAGTPVDVWYSTSREVIRIADGRIVGAVGATTEWRNVSLPPLPRWSVLAAAPEYRWVRERDAMPGYRFGINDSLIVRRTAPPARTALRNLDPQSLTWFEESTSRNASEPLPPARYGVQISARGEQVVYGEQCLDSKFCFTWQRWPAQAEASVGK